MGKLYPIMDVEHRMYECPVCGALYRVHQYERKFYSHTRCSIKTTIIKARISKLKCETCDKYPQISVP